MGDDFFDQLDAELAELTRDGAHLDGDEQGRHRRGRLVKRGLVGVTVAVALAASLASEFPAAASGHVQLARSLPADTL